MLNSELINGSGLGLTEGMYSIYAPNTADDMVYPGLYRLNGITVGSMTDFYGYAIVMSSLDHTIIKQLIYHNDSSQSLLRYRFNNQWTDAGEFALKDDLADIAQIISGNSSDVDISAGTAAEATITFNIPSGYKYIGITDAWSNNNRISSTNRWLASNENNVVTIKVSLVNFTSSQITAQGYAGILVMKQ